MVTNCIHEDARTGKKLLFVSMQEVEAEEEPGYQVAVAEGEQRLRLFLLKDRIQDKHLELELVAVRNTVLSVSLVPPPKS